MKVLKFSPARFAVALTAVAALAVPSAASAATAHIWLNGPVGANTWVLSGSSWSNVTDHAVWYTGSGTVGVCEKVFDISRLSTVSNKCAANIVHATPDLNGLAADVMQPSAKNNSAFTHTIVGDIITP